MTMANAGAKPTKRNPNMVIAMTYGALVAANIVGSILARATGIGLLATLVSAGAYGFFAVIMMGMVGELKRFSGSDIAPWMAVVPILNIWFFAVKLPAEMAKAKQSANVANPTKPAWMYFLAAPYALSSDLNDLAA